MKKLVVVVVSLMALAVMAEEYDVPPTNRMSSDNTGLSTVVHTSGWSIVAAKVAEIRLAEGGTMSGPVLAVSIVTNVTVADNSSGCHLYGNSHVFETLAHFENCKPYRAATEKFETIEVIEVKTLRFDWDGEECVIERKKVLSRKVRRWVRKDDWVEE